MSQIGSAYPVLRKGPSGVVTSRPLPQLSDQVPSSPAFPTQQFWSLLHRCPGGTHKGGLEVARLTGGAS